MRGSILNLTSKQKTAAIILCLVLVGFGVYANSFQNKMFWDDDDGILKNAYVRDWGYFPKYFSENLIAGAGLVSNYWRPMLLMMYSTEWQLWGANPVGYHVVDTTIHIGAAILLFFLLQKLFKLRWLAFLTSLIFLVHPLQTEAVTYVSGRGDPLSALFIFAGILCFLEFRDSKWAPIDSPWFYGSIAFYILGLLTKETAIVMVVLLALCDFFYQEPQLKIRDKGLKIIKSIWPFLIVAGIYITLRATILNFDNTFNVYNEETIFTENFHVRLFTFFKVLTMYVSLLFLPIKLHMERDVPIATSLGSPEVLLGGGIALLMLILAFTQIRKRPIISFGIFWFLIKLFPNSNLAVPNSAIMYEHWMYVPMIGFWLVILWLLSKLLSSKWVDTFSRSRKSVYAVSVGLFTAFLIFLGFQTIGRNAEWRDPITFYGQTMQFNDKSYRVINNLAMAYADDEQHTEAERHYKKAIEIDPNNSVAYHNLANTHKEMGMVELAEQNYIKALELDPGFFFSYNALMELYLNEAQKAYEAGDRDRALLYLSKAQALDPANSAIRRYIEAIESQ